MVGYNLWSMPPGTAAKPFGERLGRTTDRTFASARAELSQATTQGVLTSGVGRVALLRGCLGIVKTVRPPEKVPHTRRISAGLKFRPGKALNLWAAGRLDPLVP
jgi:hypothetical protein